ncbi:hypothetical protein [uncultured Muribaculum sp.]|uniref:hypothetical protein n=1 Tax=uncultured Muribaculum sp. TaxID=1918613 RepID=UPI0025FE77F1|nr:hypothetical protein [uncultured Muribaculum sp.]
MRKLGGCHDNLVNHVILLIIIVSLCGCSPKAENGMSDIEKYRSRYDWIDPKDNFDRLGEKGMTYEEVVEKYGSPVYEFDDTVIKGMNIKTALPDYDLYPLTLDRDSVFVHRCWWFLSYKTDTYLYLVFESNSDSDKPIYGYMR